MGRAGRKVGTVRIPFPPNHPREQGLPAPTLIRGRRIVRKRGDKTAVQNKVDFTGSPKDVYQKAPSSITSQCIPKLDTTQMFI